MEGEREAGWLGTRTVGATSDGLAHWWRRSACRRGREGSDAARVGLHCLLRERAGGCSDGRSGGSFCWEEAVNPLSAGERPGRRASGIRADRWGHESKSVTLTSRFSIGVKTSGPNERIQILCIWENMQACHELAATAGLPCTCACH